MDWIANEEMKCLLEKVEKKAVKLSIEINTQQLYRLLFPPMKKVGDCILVSTKDVQELSSSINYAISTYGDKTGYEACSSETRINDFFDSAMTKEELIQIALIIIRIWNFQLKEIAPEDTFCFILCADGTDVELRFHKNRKNEVKWLSNNIESYIGTAVGYTIQ